MRTQLSLLLLGLATVTGRSQSQVPGGSSPPPFIRGSENTEEALDIYAELTGRTVLRPGTLPQLPVSIKADLPTDTNAAIALIVGELAKCHLDVVPDRETFVRVLP